MHMGQAAQMARRNMTAGRCGCSVFWKVKANAVRVKELGAQSYPCCSQVYSKTLLNRAMIGEAADLDLLRGQNLVPNLPQPLVSRM